MGRINTDQSHSVLATLAMNVSWEEIDFEGARLQDLVIRNPKEAGQQFTAFLKNGGRVIVANAFPIWKTIKLGTGLKNANDFRRDLTAGGLKIGNWGNDILGKPAFKVSDTKVEVDLANVSVAELGFKDGATFKDVCERAISLGLELCPNEVGPQLRRQYKDQPKGEWLRIAMKAIADSDGFLRVFNLVHDGDGLWLNGSIGSPGYFLDGGSRLVFVRPRK